ncbi:MAG: 2-oxoacid ferredoxin oxidoreductase, partial [Anaerolineae bacterium]
LEVLQPCVTFNRKNTYDWYRERVYDLQETGHDPTDRVAAFEKALEWGNRIPLGLLYRVRRPTYEEQVPVLEDGPLARRKVQTLSADQAQSLLAEFA